MKTTWSSGELDNDYGMTILLNQYYLTFASIRFFCSTAKSGEYYATDDYIDNMNDDNMTDDAVKEAEAEEQQNEGNEEQNEENQQQDNEEQNEENQQQDNEVQNEENQQQDNGEQKEENQQQGNENQNREEGGGRQLKQIDCNRCNELQCFDKYADDDTVVSQASTRGEIDTYIGEWVEEVANCKATNEVINGNLPVYIGPICSDYADTFEIGAFLDEDCSIYTKLASFEDIAAAEKANYSVDVAGYAINSLKAAFYQPVTCETQVFAEVSTHFFYSHWFYQYNYDAFKLIMSLLHCVWC